MAKSQRPRHSQHSTKRPSRPNPPRSSGYQEPPRHRPEHRPEPRRPRPEYDMEEPRRRIPRPPPPPMNERTSRSDRRPSEHRTENRYPPPQGKRITEMGIDMHVLENIDKNPNISVDHLSYELGVDRHEILASIRRLRTDRARFIEVQKRVETKRFHKVVKEHTDKLDDNVETYEY